MNGRWLLSPAQYRLYGPCRARLDLEGQWHRPALLGIRDLAGTWSLGGSLEVMSRTGSGIPRDREILESSYLLDGLGGFGLFLRLVSGQDYANVLYVAGRVNMLQLGFQREVSPRLRYCFAPGGADLGGARCGR